MNNNMESHYDKWIDTRKYIVAAASLPTLLPTMTSTALLPSIDMIRDEFSTDDTTAYLIISLYTLFSGITQIFYGSYSDINGRKNILMFALLSYVMTNVLSYYSFSIYYLVSMRVIQALALGSTTVVGVGVISDVYPKEIRGYAMGWFAMLSLLGNSLGPLIGGTVGMYYGWKTIFIVLAIIGVLMLVAVGFMPETLHKISFLVHTDTDKDNDNDRNKDKEKSESSSDENECCTIDNSVSYRSIFNQYIDMILLAFNTKDILSIIFFRSLCMVIFYLLMYEIPIVLSRNYGWNQFNIGLTMIPIGLSMIVSGIVGGKISDVLPKIVSVSSVNINDDNSYEPKCRLIPCILSGLFLPILFVSYGILSTVNPYLSIFVAIIASTFVSLSRSGMLSYCVEMNQESASSISACLGSFQFVFLSMIIFASPKGMNVLGLEIFNQIVAYALIFSLLPILLVIFRSK